MYVPCNVWFGKTHRFLFPIWDTKRQCADWKASSNLAKRDSSWAFHVEQSRPKVKACQGKWTSFALSGLHVSRCVKTAGFVVVMPVNTGVTISNMYCSSYCRKEKMEFHALHRSPPLPEEPCEPPQSARHDVPAQQLPGAPSRAGSSNTSTIFNDCKIGLKHGPCSSTFISFISNPFFIFLLCFQLSLTSIYSIVR